MIDPKERHLSISRQCELLGVSRAHHYYKKRPERREDIEEKIKLKESFLKYPFYGYRKHVLELESDGIFSTTKRVRRLVDLMGITAIYQKPNLPKPNLAHKIYPYLLRNMNIDRPDLVWAADITYCAPGLREMSETETRSRSMFGIYLSGTRR